MMWSSLLVGLAVGMDFPADAELPADALQPANVISIASVMERLAALETQTAEREAKQRNHIAHLERRVRELESAQSLHERILSPSPVYRTPPGRSAQPVQWFETAVRWHANGERVWSLSESQEALTPQPYQARGYVHRGGIAVFIRQAEGRETLPFWIVPPRSSAHPFQEGYLFGVDLKPMRGPKRSFVEELDDLLYERLLCVDPRGLDSW